MAASCSNTNGNFSLLSTVYFLFTPLAGLVCYTYLIYVTKPSPLMLIGKFESLSAFLTVFFIAFAAAAAVAGILALLNLSKSQMVSDATAWIGHGLFAALTTILALVALENFTYTMFRFGILNTHSAAAKLFYVGLSAALIWAFFRLGKTYQIKLRQNQPTIFNGIVALAGVIAAFNTSISGPAWASRDLHFPSHHNILILSSDGIDAARTSAYGYERKTTPFLDSVADEFLIARNAYPNNGHTTGAITSLLTGMLPTRTDVVFPPDSLSGDDAHRSLPRLLRMQGYYAANIAVPHYADASEQNMLEAFDVNNNRDMLSSSLPVAFKYKATNWFFDRLVSESTGIVQDVLWLREMPNPFSQVDGHTRGYKYGFNDRIRLNSILDIIDSRRAPFFINSHFLGTHGPFFEPEITKFSNGNEDADKPWSRDRYDDAVLTFDHYVGLVYDALKKRKLLNSTILVVMSDHGISHDPRKKVPLMIRFPGKAHAGTVIEENVQVIDIAPTLVEFLGAKIPHWMEGASLIASDIPADRNIFSASVEKIGFLPGVGVVKVDRRRFGTMDYFYLMHCDTQFKLNVMTGDIEVTNGPQPGTRTCSPEAPLSKDAAKQIMMSHLEQRYPL